MGSAFCMKNLEEDDEYIWDLKSIEIGFDGCLNLVKKLILIRFL